MKLYVLFKLSGNEGTIVVQILRDTWFCLRCTSLEFIVSV